MKRGDRRARDPDLFVVHGSDRDPDGSRLSEVIAAHACYNRLRGWRHRSVHVLALLGAVVWLGAFWPQLVPPRYEEVAIDTWPLGLAVTFAIGARELYWYRRRAAYLSDREGGPSGRPV